MDKLTIKYIKQRNSVDTTLGVWKKIKNKK
jgi:hypothetical protein